MSRILIVEDDTVLCRVLRNWLERKKMQVEVATTLAGARRIMAAADADIVLSDLRLPDGDGIELLEWMNEQHYRIPFIVMTQHAEVLSAVRAMKAGAEDYLPKPFLPETLYTMLNGLLHRTRAKRESGKGIFRRESDRIREVERRAALVGSTDLSVLIRGENGTGKEHVALAVHKAGARAERPFVAVDCGSIPRELAASEFFGHVKGAFTGAADNKTGVFHEAEGGTLFLDEVGNLPYEVQVLLLRALQERRYRPVGGRRETVCDVRIVAATNENIEKAIAEGRFREDLYHRLNEFTIEVPPLRECPDDILPLAEFFREIANNELECCVTGFDAEARKRLLTHAWPGNVRELRQKIMAAVLEAQTGIVTKEHLELAVTKPNSPVSFALRNDVEERERILRALKQANGNRKVAAELLGIGRTTLYKKLEEYDLRYKFQE